MSNSIIAIETERAPRPLGHYVQATEAAGVVFVSGQLAASDGASLEDQPFEVQARQALANIIAIYAEVLGDHRPAARWCRFRRYITAT
jgi:2-iminobutanoate/2-iminopropanoate deaminase